MDGEIMELMRHTSIKSRKRKMSKLKFGMIQQERLMDEMMDESDKIMELTNILKNETLKADETINNIISDVKGKWRESGKNAKNDLKSLYTLKNGILKTKKKKLNELKVKVEEIGINAETDGYIVDDSIIAELNAIKNDYNDMSFKLFVNYNDYNVNKSFECVSIGDTKKITLNTDNELRVLKDENKKLKIKLDDEIKKAELYKNDNLVELQQKVDELTQELDTINVC